LDARGGTAGSPTGFSNSLIAADAYAAGGPADATADALLPGL
jgi:hypothetical protein